MQFWTSILLASFAQGLFLVVLLIYGRRLKTTAGVLFMLYLSAPALISLEYLSFTSGIYHTFPHLLGITFSLVFLIGPLLWFYTRAMLDDTFRLKLRDSWHLLFALANTIYSLPLYVSGASAKARVIDIFLAGQLPLHFNTKLLFTAHVLHLGIYLIFNEIQLRSKLRDHQWMSQYKERMDWLRFTRLITVVFLILMALAYLHAASRSRYSLMEIFTFAISNSVIIYIYAGMLFAKPGLVTGERLKKHKSSKLPEKEVETHLVRLRELIEVEKIFTAPELKLAEVATMMQISPHLLSQIINDHFQQSFVDYINFHRVEEFKKHLASADNEKFTLLTIALEAGFNSKTAFNVAFKKFTGLTPSEYKRLNTK